MGRAGSLDGRVETRLTNGRRGRCLWSAGRRGEEATPAHALARDVGGAADAVPERGPLGDEAIGAGRRRISIQLERPVAEDRAVVRVGIAGRVLGGTGPQLGIETAGLARGKGPRRRGQVMGRRAGGRGWLCGCGCANR